MTLLLFLTFNSVNAIEQYFSSFSDTLKRYRVIRYSSDFLGWLCLTTKEPLRNELEEVAKHLL